MLNRAATIFGLIFVLVLGNTPGYATPESCRQYAELFANRFYDYGALQSWVAGTELVSVADAWDLYTRMAQMGRGNEIDEAAERLRLLPPTDRLAIARKAQWKTILSLADYREQLAVTSQWLPDGGKILDLGCGNGTACGFLKFDRPDRNFLLIDADGLDLAMAREKMALVEAELPPSDLTAEYRQVNVLTELDLAENSLDGAVANFFFMYIPAERQPALLKKIFRALKSGAPLVVHVGLPGRDPGSLVEEAVANGSGLRRGDFGILGSFYDRRVELAVGIAEHFPFLPFAPSPFERLAQRVGFVAVLPEAEEFFDYFRLIFRKP